MPKIVIFLVNKKNMASLALFQSFEKENYIEEQNIQAIELYILSNLNSNYSPCRSYWEKQHNLCNKLYIVCHWRKKKDLRAIAKKGETVCNGELVNLKKKKKHKNCICASC